jgi:tetratricopeptide (TPR) repeat protein
MLPVLLALALFSADADADVGRSEVRKAAKLAAKKPYAASERLWPMLERAEGPLADEIRYHLARSLTALDMPAAAEPYLRAIVEDGPDAKEFAPAAELLVEIAEHFHDIESLEPLAVTIPREALPDMVEPYFLYLQGVHAAEAGDLAVSRRLLDDVLPPVRPYAKFYQGVVFAKQGKLQSAYGAFLDVHQASGDGRVAAPPDLQDAAIMNVARIYFDVERWDEANKYYRMIGKKSPYWGEALLESGWTYFLADQLEPALARVLTVKATPGVWLPEATVLECLIYYSANAFQEAENELFRFENDGNSLHYEMEELLAAAKDHPEVAWDTAFAEADGSDLPPVLRAILRRDRAYQAARERLEQIASERLSVKVAPPEWKASVGTHIDAQLERAAADVQREGGKRVLEVLDDASKNLNELLVQAELIRFEISEARRKDFEERAANPTMGERKAPNELRKKPGP